MVLLSHLVRKPAPLAYSVERGRRVYSGLYGGRHGTIVAVDGEQDCIDVIFDDGRRSPQLPTSILQGPQWRMLDELDDETAVVALEATALTAEQAATEAAARAADEFQCQVAALRADASLRHLTRAEDGDRDLGIRNVRQELKHRFKGVKFSVRNRRGYGVSVRWFDGPTVAQVNEALAPFNDRSFDSYQDCYTYFTTPWHKVFGSCDFTASREYTDEFLERALTRVIEDHAELKDWDRVPVASLNRGECPPLRDCRYPSAYIHNVSDAMHHIARTMSG